MGSILPFIARSGAVFNDLATQVMGEAFDAACKKLHDKGQPTIVYEVIAKRIIDAAKKGERDPVRLRNAGLAALGFDKEERGGLGRLTGELVLDQRKPRPRAGFERGKLSRVEIKQSAHAQAPRFDTTPGCH